MTALHCDGHKLDDQGVTDIVSEAIWTVYSKEHGEVSCKAFHLKASPAQIHLLCAKDFVSIPVPELSNMLLFPFPSLHPSSIPVSLSLFLLNPRLQHSRQILYH